MSGYEQMREVLAESNFTNSGVAEVGGMMTEQSPMRARQQNPDTHAATAKNDR